MSKNNRAVGGDPTALPFTIEPFDTLRAWGWDESRTVELRPLAGEGLWPARVIAQHRGVWNVVGNRGVAGASPTGRLRHIADDGDLPAVGDWVGCVTSPHYGEARIDAVLPRRSAFRRRAAGSRPGAQILAANVDTLFVATSLNGDLNPRRLERYVAMGRESRAEPVVLLTKADLVEDADGIAARLESDLRVPVVAISSRTGEGIEAVGRWFQRGKTLALVGSSGVGKSTLLNRLAGEELMATREIRDDDSRGRHTTTHRELFLLANGALVLDTPGMRELGLWDAEDGVDETFTEIAGLATACRFADCSHRFEPGCAVLAAVRAGRIDSGRLKSYRRLAHELADQPSTAQRRERARRFQKAVRNASADSMARKRYGNP
jgi:ribosome biogenesis GTPase / thiamine phosphate phosphatase